MIEEKTLPNFDPHRASQQLELNFCPRCGHALTDMQAFGRVQRVCPACGLVVFRDHKVAAAVVVEDPLGRVLLVRRAWKPMQGYWSLPAGFVEYDEDPAAAAVRECSEETGIVVDNLHLLMLIAGREHDRGADLVVVYTGCLVAGDPSAADDADAVGFFSLDALPPLAFRATQEALVRFQELRGLSSISDSVLG